MDKYKLVNIIIKDLEEIKILSEEVVESENDSSLVLGLALNKARLLCQEIELLRDMTAKVAPLVLPANDTSYDDDENEVEDHTYADPELEIISAEDREEEEQEELPAEEEDEDDFEESEEEEFSEEEQELVDFGKEEMEEELTGQMEEKQDMEQPEFIADEEEEDHWEEEESVAEEEEVIPTINLQSTALKNGLQPGVREIHIEELDEEDDIEPIRFSPVTGTNTRPPMREIPKPEDVISEEIQEKKFVGDKYHEVRSLNDTIGEHKSMDSKLGHSPITSLKSSIGLNDRFLFIREIFNNNSARYNEVIDRLDQMEQIQEAVEYLRANLSMQKNEASMKFVELLKRRFSK